MRRRRLRTIALSVVAAALVAGMVANATPWPSAMLIRGVFEMGARSTVSEMEAHVGDTQLDERLGLEYGEAGDADTTFDVILPAGATEQLPVVVWVHGGAWISGSSVDVRPYLRILAGEGYAAIGLDYSLAPERTAPTAIAQLNAALAHIDEHAADLGIDPSRIVLAGDSAGAQLASQLAALTTNPHYAQLVGLTPSLDASQLVGTILHCGVYDMQAMSRLNGIMAWGLKIALWAYSGTKEWSDTSTGATMSTIDFVTADFPPTFITGGNGDALTWLQTVPMADALRGAGVDVTQLVWPENHDVQLPHEYQFHLDLDEAQTALADTLDYLERVTAPAA